MAIHAPAHRETRELIHRFHRLNRAVTFMAGLRRAKFRDVSFVIELHEIWKHVNLLPGDRIIVVVAVGDFLDVGFIGRDNQMTVHADVQ